MRRLLAPLVVFALTGACSFDWDKLDPGDPVISVGPGSGGSTASTGGGGGASTSSGGAGGAGGSECPEGAGGPIGDQFGDVSVVTEIFDDASAADDPFFSADLRELYFNSNRDGAPFQIYRSTRACPTDPWSAPVMVAELDLGLESTTPLVSPDGLQLFVSYSEEMPRDFDIYQTRRMAIGEPWSTPLPIAALNSLENDRANWYRADGLAMGIDSGRDGSPDLFIASRASIGDTWSTITAIDDVNGSGTEETEAWMSPDELTIYFSRDGGVFRARRTSVSAAWIEEEVSELNADGASDPWLSPDERYIMFTRDVDGRATIHQASR